MLKDYNGYTGDERIRAWQFGWWCDAMGIKEKATRCDICGSTQGVQYHSEDYYSIFSAPSVCKGCHYVLHRRFREPRMWYAFVEKHMRNRSGPTPWFAYLTAEEIDFASYVRGRFGDGARDLLNSPLYDLRGGVRPTAPFWGNSRRAQAVPAAACPQEKERDPLPLFAPVSRLQPVAGRVQWVDMRLASGG